MSNCLISIPKPPRPETYIEFKSGATALTGRALSNVYNGVSSGDIIVSVLDCQFSRTKVVNKTIATSMETGRIDLIQTKGSDDNNQIFGCLAIPLLHLDLCG
jgi:hypothetical protein